MKKIFLVCLLLAFTTVASAEVYVLYDKSSKEIKSISNEDDAVLESGWEKIVLQGELEDYPLVYNPKYYKMNGNKFVANTKKISDEENEKQKKTKIKEELDLIINQSYKTACEALEASGTVFDEIKCTDF